MKKWDSILEIKIQEKNVVQRNIIHDLGSAFQNNSCTFRQFIKKVPRQEILVSRQKMKEPNEILGRKA